MDRDNDHSCESINERDRNVWKLQGEESSSKRSSKYGDDKDTATATATFSLTSTSTSPIPQQPTRGIAE